MGVVSDRVYFLLFYLVLLLACLIVCLFFLSFFADGRLTNSWNRGHFKGLHGEGPVSKIHETSLNSFHGQKLLFRN